MKVRSLESVPFFDNIVTYYGPGVFGSSLLIVESVILCNSLVITITTLGIYFLKTSLTSCIPQSRGKVGSGIYLIAYNKLYKREDPDTAISDLRFWIFGIMSSYYCCVCTFGTVFSLQLQ